MHLDEKRNIDKVISWSHKYSSKCSSNGLWKWSYNGNLNFHLNVHLYINLNVCLIINLNVGTSGNVAGHHCSCVKRQGHKWTTIFTILFSLFLFFSSLLSMLIIEKLLASKYLFSKSCLQRQKTFVKALFRFWWSFWNSLVAILEFLGTT